MNQLQHTSSKGKRGRVVIGHPFIGRGGSEAKVMWLIEALKHNYEMTVATTGGWDLAELNAYYGTKIGEDEVQVRIAPIPSVLRNCNAAAFRNACYQRFASHIAAEYDLRISAYNFTDWGLPGIHFIADFSWHSAIRSATNAKSSGLIYRDTPLRAFYLGVAAMYANGSGRDVLREDIVVANSQWCATLMRQECGVECAAIVYPCVWTEFPLVEWREKEHAFAMIGRIAPEKEIEQAITILDAVRRRGHHIRLHLCGQIGNDRYGRRIAALCKEQMDWILVEGRVHGAKKAAILGRCQFGLQTRRAEPFGISVAEMVKAGAIVFTPKDGGQVEILNHDDLLFRSVQEAVDKIDAVLSSTERQAILRKHLAQRTNNFGPEQYIREISAMIAFYERRLCG